VNVSDDRRGLAYDAMPPGRSARRPSRDQNDLPDRLDPAVVTQAIIEMLRRCDDPDSVMNEVERIRRHATEGGEGGENGMDHRRIGRDEAAPFPGRPRVGGAQDRQIALDRAQNSFSRRHPDISAMLGRIKTYGY
jgi:hypothetical protein